jgi:hypothetical protein
MVLSRVSNFLSSGYSNRGIFVVVFIIIAAIVIDTSLIKTYDLIGKKESLGWRTIVFSVIVAISIVGQYLVLGFVKQKRLSNILNPKEIHLNILHRIVTLVQYFLITLLMFVLLQVLITSHYSTIILGTVTSISYVVATAMLALLSQRFFSWYKSNRNFVVLSYGLSAALLAINVGFTFFLVSNAFANMPREIFPTMVGSDDFSLRSPWANVLNYSYFISSIISFLVTWVATALLLLHYSYKLGKVKYWIILAIPLVYFMGQFVTFFLNIFQPLLQAQPIFYSILVTLFFTLSKPIGGILFGIAFWTLARSIRQDNAVRNYMIISAYGFVLLFASNQAIVLVTAPYPPFGLATISFVGLSSYLLMLGIYSSAISVSLDIGLRKAIRKSVTEQSNLLHSIGTAQMEKELQSRVLTISRKLSDKIEEETGVESSMTEVEMKQYLNDVLKEIKTNRSNPI